MPEIIDDGNLKKDDGNLKKDDAKAPEFKTAEEALKAKLEASVSKDEYNKVLEENRKLYGYILDGKDLDKIGDDEPQDREINEIKKDLYGTDHISNLEAAKLTLELRAKIISEGGQDPFLPVGHGITVEASDREKANRVAEGFQHCIDVAEGDPQIFNMELSRITKDAMPISPMRR